MIWRSFSASKTKISERHIDRKTQFEFVIDLEEETGVPELNRFKQKKSEIRIPLLKDGNNCMMKWRLNILKLQQKLSNTCGMMMIVVVVVVMIMMIWGHAL